MNRPFHFVHLFAGIASLLVLLLSVGCVKKSPAHEDDLHNPKENKADVADAEAQKEKGGHSHEPGEEAGTSFKEGRGLRLSEEAKQAMGFETVQVEERNLVQKLSLRAQVYRSAKESNLETTPEAQGYAYATAFIEAKQAKAFKKGQKLAVDSSLKSISAVVDRIDAGLVEINGQAEVIIRILDPSKILEAGQVIDINVSSVGARKIASIPASAVLETTEGRFAYVANGDSYVRTSIQVGEETDGFMEVIDGLYEGDKIVSKPVKKLWLIELRFTKGGGHSH